MTTINNNHILKERDLVVNNECNVNLTLKIDQVVKEQLWIEEDYEKI